MRRTRFIANLSALLVFVTGACSSSGGSAEVAPAESFAAPVTTIAETTTTATTTTSTTSTTTTTLDPLTLSQQAYFFIFSEINAEVTELNNRYVGSGGIPWSDLPAFCAEEALLREKEVAKLSTYNWIDTAQDEIDEMIAANVAGLTYLYECANAPGTYDAQASIVEASNEAGNRAAEAASAARFALGLPIERE